MIKLISFIFLLGTQSFAGEFICAKDQDKNKILLSFDATDIFKAEEFHILSSSLSDEPLHLASGKTLIEHNNSLDILLKPKNYDWSLNPTESCYVVNSNLYYFIDVRQNKQTGEITGKAQIMPNVEINPKSSACRPPRFPVAPFNQFSCAEK